jgi:hypothetical protein
VQSQSYYFQESGITPTTVARRVATRDEQPTAGPSGTQGNDGEEAEPREDTVEASPRRSARTRAGAVSVILFLSIITVTHDRARQQDTHRMSLMSQRLLRSKNQLRKSEN